MQVPSLCSVIVVVNGRIFLVIPIGSISPKLETELTMADEDFEHAIDTAAKRHSLGVFRFRDAAERSAQARLSYSGLATQAKGAH